MIGRIALALALVSASAAAQQAGPPAAGQQQPDPAFMQRAVQAVVAQRNAALDGQAAAEARIGMLTEEVQRLTAQVTALEAAAKRATDDKKE